MSPKSIVYLSALGDPYRLSHHFSSAAAHLNIPLRQEAAGHGLRPSRGFFSAGLASITARIASRCLCTTSRKASTVGDDGAARRQLIRNSTGAEAGCNRQKTTSPPARSKWRTLPETIETPMPDSTRSRTVDTWKAFVQCRRALHRTASPAN